MGTALAIKNLNNLDYMERWVNNGSPSGFGVEGQLSKETNPFDNFPFFHPFRVHCPSGLESEVLRATTCNSFPVDFDFLIHPDMRGKWESLGCSVDEAREIQLVPTSSGRTTRVASCDELRYLKFDFDRTLGRVNRAITKTKAQASVEITDELVNLIRSGTETNVSVLPEYAVHLARPRGGHSEFSGLLYRSGTPEGLANRDILNLVPLFSFWSIDRKTSSQGWVLQQVFGNNVDAFTLALEEACLDLLDFYFVSLFRRGLQLEFNAQNVLIGISNELEYASSCIRDFNSTEKDYPLRLSLGLHCDFASAPYKVLQSEDEHYYKLRHSFAFDFKFSHYIVSPAIATIEAIRPGQGLSLLSQLRSRTQTWLQSAPLDMFPSRDVWYRHPRVDLTVDRPYEECRSPLLR